MTIPLNQIIGMPAYSPYYPMPPALYRHTKFHLSFSMPILWPSTGYYQNVLLRWIRGSALRKESQFPGLRTMELSRKVQSPYHALLKGKLGISPQLSSWIHAPVYLLVEKSTALQKFSLDISVNMDERVMITDTRLPGASILNIRSTMHQEASIDDKHVLKPNWCGKVIHSSRW